MMSYAHYVFFLTGHNHGKCSSKIKSSLVYVIPQNIKYKNLKHIPHFTPIKMTTTKTKTSVGKELLVGM